jgi:hypothetical protein
MSVVYNLKGTSNPSFTIGKRGATVYQGGGSPTSGDGTNGDLYIDKTNFKLYQKVTGTWSKIATSLKTVSTKTSAYSTTPDDDIILANSTSAPFTITLSSNTVESGRSITIKDMGGVSKTNNITVATEGAELIDGQATYTINNNWQSITFITDGTNWYVINAQIPSAIDLGNI